MKYFIDTSYIVALYHKNDILHLKAKELKAALLPIDELYTTEAILLEIGNSLSQTRFRKDVAKFLKFAYKNKSLKLILLENNLVKKGIERFSQRLDKEWGLVDCISFITMEKYHIQNALTSDTHFEQAGFKILMKLANF